MLKRSLGALSLSFLAMVSQADEISEKAYQAFLQSRGEASWINAAADHALAATAYRPIPALESFSSDPAKQSLGFELFHDARLSSSGMVSCSSCHMGMMGGADGSRVSFGVGGLSGTRNSPTVFNSAFNFRQFWDGRAFNLDEQSLGPITNPVEMGHDLEMVLQELENIPHYSDQFSAIYSDGLTAANLANAIAQHSRDMTRSDSRFNEHLNSGAATLSEQELRGWQRFNDVGCVSCHNGINLGGNSYQKVGSALPVSNRAMSASLDQGLFARTGREQDRQVFKVPSLNNVALTAPYFHDGSVSTLEDAVRQMGQLNAGRELSNTDVDDIVSFLGSLSSEAFVGMSPQMGNGGGMHHQMHQRMQQMHHGRQRGRHMSNANHRGANAGQSRQMRGH